MRLTNTLTGEHFLVSRMACGYIYRLMTPGTQEDKTMTNDQLKAYLARAEIKEIDNDQRTI